MRYAIPRQTRKLINSTNGFTIGKPYPIVQVNRWGSAHVINDNGHNRFIPTDGSSNAHLQYRYGLEAHCAGVFEIVDIVTDNVHPPIPVATHDWQAWVDGTEENGNYGWGPTEQRAVQDLANLLLETEKWTNLEVTR